MFVVINGALQYVDDSVLTHHGVKGMKWGIRRYQNPDGSLTPAGKKRRTERIAKDYQAQLKRDGGGNAGREAARRNLHTSDTINELYNDPAYRKAREKFYAIEKEIDDFYNDPKLLTKYQRKRAEEVSRFYDYDLDAALNGVRECDAKRTGPDASIYSYMRDIGKDNWRKERTSAIQEIAKTGNKLVDAYLGEYGNTPVKELYRRRGAIRWTTVREYAISDALSNVLLEHFYMENEERYGERRAT